jgi:hypothetical protein
MTQALGPTPSPAVDFVRALPWSLTMLAAGGAAVLGTALSLPRRHPAEAGLGAALSTAPLALVFTGVGRPALGAALCAAHVALAASAALVSYAVRAVPGAPRIAPGNEQRMLALAVVGLLAGTALVSTLAVEWEAIDGRTVSALAVAAALGGVGILGLLTRRHWLSLVFAGQTLVLALTLGVAALPGGATASYLPLFALWDPAIGAAGLLLCVVALARGHGSWVEA